MILAATTGTAAWVGETSTGLRSAVSQACQPCQTQVLYSANPNYRERQGQSTALQATVWTHPTDRLAQAAAPPMSGLAGRWNRNLPKRSLDVTRSGLRASRALIDRSGGGLSSRGLTPLHTYPRTSGLDTHLVS
ncbi:hypothetical protein AAFF_G00388160 [Aldrovandia affinis]|uniref:Uncharacterized protein n=1 Tax=Aldrovandia affinis TaxID=143900 RepID=A0AAD7WM92_9TELE|nr:hypothetical protein AAFF_G00388160 [Aldrovandia affinis]